MHLMGFFSWFNKNFLELLLSSAVYFVLLLKVWVAHILSLTFHIMAYLEWVDVQMDIWMYGLMVVTTVTLTKICCVDGLP